MLSLQSSTLNYLSVLPPFSKEDSLSAIFFFSFGCHSNVCLRF
jgi:hypothetical protein